MNDDQIVHGIRLPHFGARHTNLSPWRSKTWPADTEGAFGYVGACIHVHVHHGHMYTKACDPFLGKGHVLANSMEGEDAWLTDYV